MSRLSVALFAVAFAVLSPLVANAAGEQRMLIRYAHQLNDDPEVMRLSGMYGQLSESNIVFSLCSKEWVLTPPQKEYLETRFDSVSREYLNAYIDAYTKRVGGDMPPSQEMVDTFAEALRDQQKKKVDNMAMEIRKKGCRSNRVYRSLANFEKMRQLDTKPKAVVKPTILKE